MKRDNRLSSLIASNDLREGFRFIRDLPSFFRNPIRPKEAEGILAHRLKNREANFLKLIRGGVYKNPASPYKKLLNIIGCDYGDIERLVQKEGVEGTLKILYRHGVYLTVNEFKGRQPVVRNNITVEVRPGLLRNPWLSPILQARTSGSRGRSTPVPIDMEFVRERTVNHCLSFAFRGPSDWVHAIWGVPGHTDMVRALEFSGSGTSLVHWYSQVDPSAPGLLPDTVGALASCAGQPLSQVFRCLLLNMSPWMIPCR